MRSVYRISSTVGIYYICLIFLSPIVFAQGTPTLKSNIYSKLDCCPCEVPFEKCDCAEAKAMKAYIDALLEIGVAHDDIFYKVAKKFSLNVILDKQIKVAVEQRLIKETNGRYPKVIFEPISLDFGKAHKRQGKVSRDLKLHNRGNADLIITNIRASCGCVTVSLKVGKEKSPYFSVAGAHSGWQTVIKPGEFGELEVVLDLNHASMGVGKQNRSISISSNDPLNSEATVQAEIEVKE